MSSESNDGRARTALVLIPTQRRGEDAEPPLIVGTGMTEQPTGAVTAPSSPRALRWPLQLLGRRHSVILAYHGIGTATLATDPDHVIIPPRRLRTQVRLLCEAGFRFVTVSEFAALVTERGKPPPGLAALTFDDGLVSVYEPLMAYAADGIPATVYPVVEWIGGFHPSVHDRHAARMLDRAQIRALADAGVEIGAHTVTHADLTALPFAGCLGELRESRGTLEAIIDRPVRTLAYPFGRTSPSACTAAQEAGFEAAVAEDRGAGWKPFNLQRAPVNRATGWALFVLKVVGLWPRISSSRAGRTVRSATRPVRRWAERRLDSRVVSP